MRPLSLTLDGFRSYAARIELDWRPYRLVGVVGPIGSGKSSVLDAITFALFGMTPSEKVNTKSLIHQRADIAQVELVFSVDHQVWRAVRAIRRNGQSEHALFRFESDEAFLKGAKPIEMVVKKGEVDARVRLLLGMDFDAFGRSALLAQGRFAELLRATPTQRDDVLKGVFGFDRVVTMERLAKQRRDGAKRDLEELGRKSESFKEDTAQLEIATTEAVRAEAIWQRFEVVDPVIAGLDQQIADVTGEIAENAVAIRALEDVTQRLPDPQESAEWIEDASSTEAGSARLNKELAAGEKVVLTAEAKLVELRSISGGEAAVEDASELIIALHGQEIVLRQATDRLTASTEESTRVSADLKAATSAFRSAEKQADKAFTRLNEAEHESTNSQDTWHAAQHADMASALRSELVGGHTCPVCLQAVDDVPTVASEGDLSALGAEADAGVKQVDAAFKVLAEAQRDVVRVEGKLEALRVTVGSLDEREQQEAGAVEVATLTRSETKTKLEGMLGKGDPVEILNARKKTLAATRSEVESANQEVRRLQDLKATQVTAMQESMSRLASLRLKLSELAGRLDLDLQIPEKVEGVSEAIVVVRDTWTERRRALTESQETLTVQIEQISRTMNEQRAAVGIAADASWSEALADVRVRVERARTELAVRTERIEAAGSLVADTKTAEDVFATYSSLAQELRPSRFLNYLLEEERSALAELGSHQFEDLTDGRYRFSDDGEFAIVDLTAAEQVRKSETLSGGETFLASLALALALAEMMTRSGGRIDAFFLDEGFGSLDPEHLDLALAGIERLVAGDEDRLVVLVSHVPDMVDRIEQLIRLDKDPHTGATRVIV